jgi:hypothetical protein
MVDGSGTAARAGVVTTSEAIGVEICTVEDREVLTIDRRPGITHWEQRGEGTGWAGIGEGAVIRIKSSLTSSQ